MNPKKAFLRFAVWCLILVAVSEVWEYIDVQNYGYSQKSIMDGIATIFITNWIDEKVFGEVDNA